MTGTSRDEEPGLGKRIEAARKARGLTQAQLANLMDVSTRTIIRIEGGKVPDDEQARKLERQLGIPVVSNGEKGPAPLDEISRKLDDLRQDVDRIVRALGLDETPGETQEPAQLLATVVSLEQQIARLLEALGGPDAARWLNGSPALDEAGAAIQGSRIVR